MQLSKNAEQNIKANISECAQKNKLDSAGHDHIDRGLNIHTHARIYIHTYIDVSSHEHLSHNGSRIAFSVRTTTIILQSCKRRQST